MDARAVMRGTSRLRHDASHGGSSAASGCGPGRLPGSGVQPRRRKPASVSHDNKACLCVSRAVATLSLGGRVPL